MKNNEKKKKKWKKWEVNSLYFKYLITGANNEKDLVLSNFMQCSNASKKKLEVLVISWCHLTIIFWVSHILQFTAKYEKRGKHFSYYRRLLCNNLFIACRKINLACYSKININNEMLRQIRRSVNRMSLVIRRSLKKCYWYWKL